MGTLPVNATPFPSNETLELSTGFPIRSGIGVNDETLESFIRKLPNLLGYYRGSETSGNLINQAPATFGSLPGVASGISYEQEGLSGDAVSFDGVNDRVIVARNTIPAWDGKSTIGFIAKVLVAPSGDAPIIDSQWGDNGAGGWQIIIDGNGHLTHAYVADDTNRDDVAPTGTMDMTDDFHLIIVSKNTTTGEQLLYIDGVLNNINDNLSFGTTEPDVDRDLVFGANHNLDTFLNVAMQHVFFMGTDISANKVARIAELAGL